MISYPGEILRRFGRYEAVEDLGASGAAHLWGAWDPYLERFVIVVALPAVEPGVLAEGLRVVDAALERWTAGKLGGDDLILDCSPGERDEPAYLVVATTDEAEEAESGAVALPQAVDEDRSADAIVPAPPAARAPEREPVVVTAEEVFARPLALRSGLVPRALVIAALLLVGAASGFLARMLTGPDDPGGAPEPRSATPARAGGGVPTRPSATARRPSATAIPVAPTATEAPAAPPVGAAASTPRATMPPTTEKPTVTPTSKGVPTETAAPAAPSDEPGASAEPTRTPLAGARTWRWGKLQMEIAAPRHAVAPGDVVRLHATLAGLSAEERRRLECEWSVNGTPMSRVCDELELRIDPEAPSAPIRVALTAQGQTKEVTIAVRALPPTPPSGSPAATAGRARGTPASPPPVAITTSVSAGETGARGAVTVYVRQQQQYLRERTKKPDARCVMKPPTLRPVGDGYEATVSYTLEIPGQSPASKTDTLRIVRRGANWEAEKR